MELKLTQWHRAVCGSKSASGERHITVELHKYFVSIRGHDARCLVHAAAKFYNWLCVIHLVRNLTDGMPSI